MEKSDPTVKKYVVSWENTVTGESGQSEQPMTQQEAQIWREAAVDSTFARGLEGIDEEKVEKVKSIVATVKETS